MARMCAWRVGKEATPNSSTVRAMAIQCTQSAGVQTEDALHQEARLKIALDRNADLEEELDRARDEHTRALAASWSQIQQLRQAMVSGDVPEEQRHECANGMDEVKASRDLQAKCAELEAQLEVANAALMEERKQVQAFQAQANEAVTLQEKDSHALETLKAQLAETVAQRDELSRRLTAQGPAGSPTLRKIHAAPRSFPGDGQAAKLSFGSQGSDHLSNGGASQRTSASGPIPSGALNSSMSARPRSTALPIRAGSPLTQPIAMSTTRVSGAVSAARPQKQQPPASPPGRAQTMAPRFSRRAA